MTSSPPDPVRADIQEILEAAKRATALTRRTAPFSSRQQPVETRVLDVHDVVHDIGRDPLHRASSARTSSSRLGQEEGGGSREG